MVAVNSNKTKNLTADLVDKLEKHRSIYFKELEENREEISCSCSSIWRYFLIQVKTLNGSYTSTVSFKQSEMKFRSYLRMLITIGNVTLGCQELKQKTKTLKNSFSSDLI